MWGGDCRFTALTGASGEGEQGPVNQPPHPEWEAFARLLLDAGADPNDGQARTAREGRTGPGRRRTLYGIWHMVTCARDRKTPRRAATATARPARRWALLDSPEPGKARCSARGSRPLPPHPCALSPNPRTLPPFLSSPHRTQSRAPPDATTRPANRVASMRRLRHMTDLSSIRQELQRSRRDVLDLSLRNPLLNFRPSKRRGIEVVDERSRELFRILVGGPAPDGASSRSPRVMYFLPSSGETAPVATGEQATDDIDDIPSELPRHAGRGG